MFTKVLRPTRQRLAPIFSAVLSAMLPLAALSAVGCGEELSDEAYGAIDLAPYFYDGSTASNPTQGLPRNLIPRKGWIDLKRAEYYDFGLIEVVRKKSSTTTPDYAVVAPMHFFFREDGRPIFSAPVFERRTGLWHMRGGKDVRNPNPDERLKDAKQALLPNVPYAVRQRSKILGSFQRPIIDTTPFQKSNYTGLWEIVEVLVPSDYEPDAIKDARTLKNAIEEKKWPTRKTGRVINCPLVDDRTFVTPTPFSYKVPRPRMEVWFRTKLGTCYLINGIETLATLDKSTGTTVATLIRAGKAQDSRRLDTFDVIRYTVGQGANQRPAVVSPVGIVFDPLVRVANQDKTKAAIELRYTNDSLSVGLPRESEEDPIGYRPIKWHWDIEVPQDPPFQGSRFKSVAALDPSQTRARSGPFTRNFPTVGVAVSCLKPEGWEAYKAAKGLPELPLTYTGPDPDEPALVTRSKAMAPDPMDMTKMVLTKDALDAQADIDKRKAAKAQFPTTPVALAALAKKLTDTNPNACTEGALEGLGLICNEFPDTELAVSPPIAGSRKFNPFVQTGLPLDPSVDVGIDDRTTQIVFEGGPRCDVKPVGFGEFCSPGISRCDALPPDPKWSSDAANNPDRNTSYGGITRSGTSGTAPNTIPRDAFGAGYACHPSPTGYCYVRCDGEATNDDGSNTTSLGFEETLSPKDLDSYKKDVAAGKRKKEDSLVFGRDTRCGGSKMLGFSCQSPAAASGYNTDIPSRLRVCLRTCSSRATEAQNAATCGAPLYMAETKVDGETTRTPVREISVGRDRDGDDIRAQATIGLSCFAANNITACIWDPAFEPRDPSKSPVGF